MTEFFDSILQSFNYAALYILIRAAIFYTLFHILYLQLNETKGICNDKPSKRQLREEKWANVRVNLFEIVFFTAIFSLGIIKKSSFHLGEAIYTFLFLDFVRF